MERSIAQATIGEATEPGSEASESDRFPDRFSLASLYEPAMQVLLLVALCLLAYLASHPERNGLYQHFILQAQSWMNGQTAIPNPGYQDVMPVLDASGNPTDMAIIPFPPLPAVILLPFVAIWHLSTNEQLLAAVFGAIDVGIAYWMLGYLPIRSGVRTATALFLGLGTVLWYASAIGTTWFWAHVVAVGFLLLAIGFALSADGEAAEPKPAGEARNAFRIDWPAGRLGAIVAALIGVEVALLAALFLLAGKSAPVPAVLGVGILLGAGAVALVLLVTGRLGDLSPFAVYLGGGGALVAAVLLFGHLNAMNLLLALVLLAIVAVMLVASAAPEAFAGSVATFRAAMGTPEARQVAAGIFFGLAVNARLTILFGALFFVFVGGGKSWLRRGLLAGSGMAIPLLGLLVYTYVATGHLFNPAYEFQYQKEVVGYGSILGYHNGWSIEDLRYVPQNLKIMLFQMPYVMPHVNPTTYNIYPIPDGTLLCQGVNAHRALFDPTCPYMKPDARGTSILVTSPPYLLAPLAFLTARLRRLDRATVAATISVLAIAFVNLLHFSQGWVQFGYRFSNDFAPFALILVALGADRLGRRWWWVFVPLLVFAIAINWWGASWGAALGW